MYLALVEGDDEFKYDIYTAYRHTARQTGTMVYERRYAVGLTTGPTATDTGSRAQAARESYFPIELTDKGVDFKSVNGQASWEGDKQRILAEIGDDGTELLDRTVHGMIASAQLERVLNLGKERFDQYLDAVRLCPARQLKIDFSTSDEGDTQENVTAVLHALAGGDCQWLQLTTMALEQLSDSLGDLHSLRRLYLRNCEALAVLPDSIGQLQALTELSLYDSLQLGKLPDSIVHLNALEALRLNNCESIVALPEAIDQLSNLRLLCLSGCVGLATLPEAITKLRALSKLDLSHCLCLRALPTRIGHSPALKELSLRWCSGLTSLPDSLLQLETLTCLNLSNCSKLMTLPGNLDQRDIKIIGWRVQN